MRFFRHVWLSRPSWQEAVITMLGWGAVVPLCILGDYLLWRHMLPLDVAHMAVVFGLGGALAAPLALWCAQIIAGKNANSAFAAMFIMLSTGTIGLTALIFAVDYWSYFSKWHGEVFSRPWVIQFVFTIASAIYQFIVLGLRLYLPLGLVALILASMWASHRITR